MLSFFLSVTKSKENIYTACPYNANCIYVGVSYTIKCMYYLFGYRWIQYILDLFNPSQCLSVNSMILLGKTWALQNSCENGNSPVMKMWPSGAVDDKSNKPVFSIKIKILEYRFHTIMH